MIQHTKGDLKKKLQWWHKQIAISVIPSVFGACIIDIVQNHQMRWKYTLRMSLLWILSRIFAWWIMPNTKLVTVKILSLFDKDGLFLSNQSYSVLNFSREYHIPKQFKEEISIQSTLIKSPSWHFASKYRTVLVTPFLPFKQNNLFSSAHSNDDTKTNKFK